MGCWNGTCMVSNLPIRDREDVAIIPIRIKNIILEHSICYNTTICEPLPILLYGKYDDYGCVYDITGDIEEFNEYMSKVVSKDTLDSHIDSTIDLAENNLKLIERGHVENIAFVMIHKELFEKLTDRYYYVDDNAEIKNIILEIYSKMTSPTELWFFETKPFYFSKRIKKVNLESITKLYHFNNNLDDLRKMWSPQCGAGNQSDIDEAHDKLNEFYFNHIKKYKKEHESEE